MPRLHEIPGCGQPGQSASHICEEALFSEIYGFMTLLKFRFQLTASRPGSWKTGDCRCHSVVGRKFDFDRTYITFFGAFLIQTHRTGILSF